MTRIPLVLLLIAAGVRSEHLFPGAYDGWLVKDRWGEFALVSGPYVLPFAKDARVPDDLPVGSAVRLKVGRFATAGDFEQHIADVDEAKRVSVGREHDVAIDVSEGIDGRELQLTIRIERLLRVETETSTEPFLFRCRDLRVVLRWRGEAAGPLNRPLVARDDHGTKWIANGDTWTRPDPEGPSRSTWIWRAPGGDLETDGHFVYTTELTVTLPREGAYEAHVVYGDTNYSNPPCSLSRLVSIDAR